MLTKFDSKSNRVKGLSFHPKRPWVLASLHNGVIQLWDYRMGTLLDRYEEHEGPVRGIDFHRSQPLFVSGGDDYTIKVWNHKLRRCLFTLLGHLDYIRTVQFHHEYPWIVSASDDQSIRLWNWQSRTCISVLAGHNHYVMCAQFHPREDLIVSASLDQTVRVWDTSGLRRKTVRGGPSDQDSLVGRNQADIFGAQDAVVKYVLEGHDRGCNWASFHPTQNLIVSGADDRQIKLWRMSDTKAWEMDTLRGHTNNVSCVLFHPRHDLIVSNSEDRSIRVWDFNKRVCLNTFRREADRFWMLALHAEQNLIAAGHDSGMVVFKLERERPAYASAMGSLFYIKDRFLRRAVLGTGSDVPLLPLKGRLPGLGQAPRILYANTFNPSGDDFLVLSNVDGGTWELYSAPSANSSANASDADAGKGQGLTAVFTARNKFAILEKSRQIMVRGLTGSDSAGKRIKPPYPNADMLFPCSTSGRLLVRCEDRICLFDLQSRKVIAELAGVSVKYAVWNADGSMVALLGKHTVLLADRELTQLSSVNETVRVKSGAWDEHGVFIYTTLNHVKYLLPVTVTPAASVAVTTEAGSSEGKAAMADGSASGVGRSGPKPSTPASLTISGIVRTLDVPVYAVEAKGNSLYVLDRDAKCRALAIDPTEHMFKLALARRQFERVLNIIKNARLCGNAVLAFLQKAGYPEIALLFVEDSATQFHLALQCGNLDIAARAAKAMTASSSPGADDAWTRLAIEAVRVGATDLAELAYQNTRAMEKLSFLYAVTGQTDKLGKMLLIAQSRNDAQSRFHNSLLLGAAGERVKVLEGAGQTALAYLTASTQGLTEDAERLRGYLEQAGLPVPTVPANARVLSPCVPVKAISGTFARMQLPSTRQGLDLAAIAAAAAAAAADDSGASAGTGDRAAAAAAAAMAIESSRKEAEREREERERAAALAARTGEEGEGDGGWGDDLDLGDAGAAGKRKGTGGGWGEEDDLGLDDATAELNAVEKDKSDAASRTAAAEADGLLLPSPGTAAPSQWVAASNLAGDHVAAGSFQSAMDLLNRQVGIVNFAPMKAGFLSVYAGARGSLPTLPGLPPLPTYFTREEADGKEVALPAVAIQLPFLRERIARVQACFTEGKFSESREVLDGLYSVLPLVVVRSKEEIDAVKAVLSAAGEYKMAVRIMQTSKAHPADDGVRQVELAAYMTHCSLEPPHLVLALNLAMTMAYKFQNYIHAAAFARRMLELPEANSAKNAQLATKAKKVLQLSEAQARNALKVDYDERAPFHVCAGSLTPIYKGQGEILRSPFSGAYYKPSFRGTVCVIDGLSAVGTETLGLVVAPSAVGVGSGQERRR